MQRRLQSTVLTWAWQCLCPSRVRQRAASAQLSLTLAARTESERLNPDRHHRPHRSGDGDLHRDGDDDDGWTE